MKKKKIMFIKKGQNQQFDFDLFIQCSNKFQPENIFSDWNLSVCKFNFPK